MDPILAEIYSTVFDAAPFVIAAYALMFLVLLVYVVYLVVKVSRAERKLEALEEHFEETDGSAASR